MVLTYGHIKNSYRGEFFVMIIHHAAVPRVFLSVSIAALIAGCATAPVAPTVGVMPGPGKAFATFQADNAACKTFASGQVQGQAEAANQRAAGAALLTTVLGTGLGAAVGAAGGNAGAGAAIGAAAGAGGGTALGAGSSSADQAAIQQQYDNAFAQCMYSRGNQVPGFAPVVAAAPAAAAAPDPMVRATQSELNRLGYLRAPADGYAGSRTRSAISSFEQANGLPVDGVASPRLLARLQSTPTNAVAAAPSNWVAPTNTSGAPPQTATAAPSGWVAPAKTQ
jgi:hypothetical protein